MNDSALIVALDYPDARAALNFVDQLEPGSCRLKIGKALFTRAGPQLVETLQAAGFQIFLDLKFHDIPATVAAAVTAAADLGVWMTNVHCLGGSRMLAAAREALNLHGGETLLTGVTVLTSMTRNDLEEVGFSCDPRDLVMTLTDLGLEAGLDGVVCSARETASLRQQYGRAPVLVTPGIRPTEIERTFADDQRRTVTPIEAIRNGASYLVVGRPVTQANDPEAALLAIKREIGEDENGD